MTNVFFFVLLTLAAQQAAAADGCTMPPNDDPGSYTDCSRFHWSADDFGGLVVRDQGDALWADEHGVLHVARRIEDTPEPYRSMYRALRKQADGSYKVQDDVPAMGESTAAADAISPYATQEARLRQSFRGAITGWRQELYDSTRMLLEAVLHAPNDGYNPLAFAYAPDRMAYREVQGDNAGLAKMRVLKARRALLEEIPTRAREQGVPQAWLQ